MIVDSCTGQAGDQVTLFSPMRTFREGSVLTFYYHMRLSAEDTMAALTVSTYSQLHVYETRLVEIRGNQGTSWKYMEICLPAGTYQLAFVATHGLQFSSDIALDEIELYRVDDREHFCRSPEYSEAENEGKYLTCTNYIIVHSGTFNILCNVNSNVCTILIILR